MLAAIAAYVTMDRHVVERLHKADSSSLSAVYSDMLTVASGPGTDLTKLRDQLIKRRYRETTESPSSPGEFSYRNGDLALITREFRSPDGRLRESTRISLQQDMADAPKQFYLEPQVVAVLGNGDVRAAENKSLDSFPELLRAAVIAIEDERFYAHHGVDLQGIARAAAKNILAMAIVEGGSTITQQLAKNLLFSPTRSFGRKVMELFASFSLENHLSKDQILEMYLNEIYLGQEGSVAIHGFAKASNVFFGKNVEDLSLAECAMLAGIIKAPSYYSPRRHTDRAVERRNVVLAKMLELRVISRQAYDTAVRSKPNIVQESLHQRHASHFVAYLESTLQSYFDFDTAVQQGLSIFTGIDVDMQECAETAISEGIKNLEKNYPSLRKKGQPIETGLVAVEPFSGKVRAWVGGRNYSENQFDHVAQAKRQIGSTVKAFLYLTALDKSLNSYKVATPISILEDNPMKVNLVTQQTWEPENFDKEFRGDVTLRYALENSLNLPAVYTAQKFGIKALAKTLTSFKLAENILPVPSLALGALDTSLLNLTSAYSGIANGGILASARPFISAVDQDGQIIASANISETKLADENAVYVLTDMLKGVVERGTGKGIRKLGYQYPVAGKTGTSNETRDNWFVGFTPDLAAGVWVGYDDNKKIGLTGGVTAAPIWTAFMQCVTRYHTPDDFVVPPGVIFVDIDAETRKRVTPECPSDHPIKEVFVRGTEPLPDCGKEEWEPIDEAPSKELKDLDTYSRPRRRQKGFWDSLLDW